MLTIEMLRQSTALNGLSDIQLAAISEMSKNDENVVIGTKIGALHGQYDTDIFGITGIKKNDGEKSYDYAKRVINEYKTKSTASSELQTKLDAANAKVTELQGKIENGEGDANIRQQLKDTRAQVTQLQTQLNTEKEAFAKEKQSLDAATKQVHVDYAFMNATSGLKFKAGITDGVKNMLLMSAKTEILSKGTPDLIDDGNGGKKLVLRDATGNIINNTKNNLNPYTISELLLETGLKDAIDFGKEQSGGGTGAGGAGGTGTGGTGNVIDMSSIKTQVEATTMIEKSLLAEGLTRDSTEFSQKFEQAYTDNKVSELPIR